jgi:D-glycero-D-manno-heptose 1,7-bisphosphate phosphatase
VLQPAQFVFTPGIQAALEQLSGLQLPMIVISNQAAVGKGLLTSAVLEDITAQMYQSLLADGIRLTAVYYCIHRSDEDCACRKPKPELLQRAADDFNIDLSRSLFIGDSETDMQAARAAGCKPVLFASNPHSDSTDWAANLPTARTASELFGVVAKCLRDETRVLRDE